MTQAAKKLSFEEYASLDAEDWVELGLPEGLCEYWEGELIELPSESELNDLIANFLMFMLASNELMPLRLIRPGKCEIEVPGNPRTRYPDLVILREEHLALTQRRLLITHGMPPPLLVAEVVSPSKKNRDRDYIAKRQQYAERGIPEYWLIDPEAQLITVLQLKGKQYALVGEFKGSDRLRSELFPTISLTAEQILRGQV